ncbi:hypothetical protein Q0601_07285 [Paracoccus onubensis]|uniref:hypothetical protein n=1 Tax=Paracoccus onubensis TaxID=1675788 RepID=UPI002731093A|nr:hypothetical protein [Paracoccus onubensis]MDP0926968.1 hypothetical protein [Paracoccus onubensis]
MVRKTDHSERLRQDIDRGRAKDKVDFPDPAAAPLGTDDEASGFPPTAEQVRHARRSEISGRSDEQTPGQPDRGFGTQAANGDGWRVAGVICFVVVILVIIYVIAT